MWPPLFHFLQAVATLVLALLVADRSLAETDSRDVEALVALKEEWALASLPWVGDPCTDRWLGIDCDSTSRVINLRLPNQRLSGKIPVDISYLTALQNLDLSYNSDLGGTLPLQIVDLVNLKQMWLLNCSFIGALPQDVGNLRNLEYLAINKNSFSGAIPPSIGYLSHLKWLDLSNNHFSGTLPVTSSSYAGLDMLTKAEHFHLYNNSFSGFIPPEICTAQMALVHLLLNNNQFHGGIPSEIGDLTNLKILRLDQNKLTEVVPASISHLKHLTSLQLNDNQLSGDVPDFSTLTDLQYIDFSNNIFNPSVFPSWFSNFSKLSLLAFNAGNLSGPLPSNLFSIPMLSSVSLSFNRINGSVDLRNAPRTLIHVDIHENNISDINIGNYIGTLLANGNPVCQTNRLLKDNIACEFDSNAPIPSSTNNPFSNCQCPAGMDPNPTSASHCLCSRPLTGLITFVAMNEASLTEYLPNMQASLELDLKLSLNQINLTSVGTSDVLIQIFPNKLISWSQPESVTIINKLINQGVNLKSYGSYIYTPIGFYSSDENKKSSGFSFGAKIGLGVGLSFAALVIIVAGIIAYSQKKRADKAEHKSKPFANWVASESQGVEAPQVATTQSFSLSVMKEVTNNFSQNNIIGEGGYGKVYLGVLPNKQEVAIKRAKKGSMQGAQEFKIEIELLSKLHHRNLVNLVGFCYEHKEQMLVYEYMPNGTLQDLLRERGAELDWKTRIRIALDAAKGLAYLHRGVDPPVIHRDIKSTNILLDSKLVAKVADFGLCKIEQDGASGSEGVETQVKGTLGYLDPEYYYTNQLSDKSDIYSFGVVLIEIITARPPILPDGTNTVREVGKIFKKAGLEGIIPLLDQNLTNYPKKDLEMYVDLALCCIEQVTNNRPSSIDVVKDLESIEPGWKGSRSSKKHQDMMQNVGVRHPSYPCSEFEYSGVYSSTNLTIEPK